jgi:sugar lactone lactonase YvrE
MNNLIPAEPVALDRLESFAFGLDHAEGITVTPKGDLYVGGEAGQIYAIVDDQPKQVATTGGFLLGLAADAEGRIYAIDNVAKTVWRYDPASGALDVFAGPPSGSFKVPNWGAFDAAGNYYLTDSGDWMADEGRIWVVRPGGGVELWTEESRAFPNGCCLSADGSRLYVIESLPGAIVEIPIEKSGAAGKRRVLCDLGIAVPDGVACATDGALIIACYRPDVIYRWHQEDGLSVLAADPRGTALAAPTNVVFTGEGRGTLVVPNLGRWHLTRGRLGVTGIPLNYPTREQLGA